MYSYSLNLLRKIKEKNSEIADEKKMSKAIEENQFTVAIKILSWEFSPSPLTLQLKFF